MIGSASGAADRLAILSRELMRKVRRTPDEGFPTGRELYRRRVREMRERGIQPAATLHQRS